MFMRCRYIGKEHLLGFRKVIFLEKDPFLQMRMRRGNKL
jgi:hypothetical protein